MKNTFLKIIAMLMLVAVTVTLFAFRQLAPASIAGRVTPAEAVKDVWAVSLNDTARGSITQGSFTINNVKPGTYKVIIDANAPYKDVVKEGVSVTEGQPVDLGEIKLDR